jgi:hypothetical protein
MTGLPTIDGRSCVSRAPLGQRHSTIKQIADNAIISSGRSTFNLGHFRQRLRDAMTPGNAGLLLALLMRTIPGSVMGAFWLFEYFQWNVPVPLNP